MSKFNVISADSHVVEPPDLWLDHIAKEYRDRAPHVVREEKSDVYVCPGATLVPVGLLAGAGRPDDEVRKEGRYETDVCPGGYDPHARLKDMAIDGVDAEVLYPTIAMRMYSLQDAGFMQACFQAYNTWVADFCKACPDRFKGVAMIATEDIKGAVSELHRTRKLGLAGAMIALWPEEESPYSHSKYEPFWAAAQELQMAVSLHIATERRVKNKTLAELATTPVWVQRAIADIIFNGVFDRFPRLKIVSAENDIGWAGNLVDRMDFFATRSKRLHTHDLLCKRLPSEYFPENVRLTFMEDLPGIAARKYVGVECLMWSSDYPHHSATWPRSQQVLAEHFKGVPDLEQRRIVCENAAELYGF